MTARIYYEDKKAGIVLYHGDCREVLPTIQAGSVDAIVTDPPYGMDLQPQRGKTKAIEGDIQRYAKALWYGTAPFWNGVLKDDTASLFFGRWSEEWAKSLLSEWFDVKGCVVWVKDNWGLGYYLRPQWELAWYCHKGSPPTPETAFSDVWDFRKVYQQVHSCEKPVALLRRAIELCGGNTILDPFAGSGTTLVAAKLLGKHAIGIEIDEKHCETTANRLRQEVLQFGGNT